LLEAVLVVHLGAAVDEFVEVEPGVDLWLA